MLREFYEIFYEVRKLLSRVRAFLVDWGNYGRRNEIKTSLSWIKWSGNNKQAHSRRHNVLPKNGSRVGIGNTWDDNGLFQANGNVLDFIVHDWWNGLLHLCKFRAINYQHTSCGRLIDAVASAIRIENLLLTSKLNTSDATADDDVLCQGVQCSAAEGLLCIILGDIYHDQLAGRQHMEFRVYEKFGEARREKKK